MQLNIADAALFIRVAELGTLSAAARERNEPVSQVSRAIARIETGLDVRLLHRSTHGLSLTDEGDAFLAHARSMLDIAAELESDLGGKLADAVDDRLDHVGGRGGEFAVRRHRVSHRGQQR